jgi:hypothetical protein
MKFVVLKELPQGQQPGDVIDVDEAVGDVLLLVGAARKPEPDEAAADDPVTPAVIPISRRSYRRRDLVADA